MAAGSVISADGNARLKGNHSSALAMLHSSGPLPVSCCRQRLEDEHLMPIIRH